MVSLNYNSRVCLVICCLLLVAAILKLPGQRSCEEPRNRLLGQAVIASWKFDHRDYDTGPELLSAHQAWQAAVLHRLKSDASRSQPPPILLVTDLIGGWGNQLPPLVTGGLVMTALFTPQWHSGTQ